MMVDRVKYWIVENQPIGNHIKRAKEILLDYKEVAIKDINDAIELFNSVLYIDKGIFLPEWTEEENLQLKKKARLVKKDIGNYLVQIKEANISFYIQNVNKEYREEFLSLFCKHKVYERVGGEVFNRLIEEKSFKIYEVLGSKNLVAHYDKSIKEVLLKKPESAELIIENYAVDKSTYSSSVLYFPKSLNKLDISSLIEAYINSNDANLNYLKLIVNHHNTSELSINDHIKWKAKKRFLELEEELFKDSTGLRFEYSLIFQRNLPEIIIEQKRGQEFSITIDKSWLENHLDYDTILQNFIWVFNFIDIKGRITLVNYSSDVSVLENSLGIKAKKDYSIGTIFRSKEIFSDLKTKAYYEFLKHGDINLETVLEWFFKEYLYKEFNVEYYSVKLPSGGTSYKEKCRDILPEIESIMLQFKNFVEYGFINHDLLEMSSGGVLYGQIPSLVEKKYVYSKAAIATPIYYLFSDQSSLGYINNPEKNSPTFFDLMIKNEVNYEEFYDHQKQKIAHLRDLGYVKLDERGILSWSNEKRIKILYELYKYEVISYHRSNFEIQNEIDIMCQENLLQFESSLFSRAEQDYLDYYLNNSKFQNGPQLRNKYTHGRLGSHPRDNESIHQQHYLIIFKLLLLVVLKINEDFCLNEKVKKSF